MTLTVVSAVRGVYGAALLVAPSAVVRAPLGRRTTVLARALGGRQLLQAAALTVHPSHRWRAGGAVVDAVHAASMVGLGVGWPRYRRLALRQALTASAFAVAQTRDAAIAHSHRRV